LVDGLHIHIQNGMMKLLAVALSQARREFSEMEIVGVI
jgi:hypothetical protein